MAETQFDYASRIVREIQLLNLVKDQTDVKLVDFPFANKPQCRIAVSPMGEVDDDSTNETSDIGYRFQIVRIKHGQNPHDGFRDRADWRRSIFNRFNRVRLGFTGELVTRSKFAELQIQKAWESWNLDASSLLITVWIRQPHNG